MQCVQLQPLQSARDFEVAAAASSRGVRAVAALPCIPPGPWIHRPSTCMLSYTGGVATLVVLSRARMAMRCSGWFVRSAVQEFSMLPELMKSTYSF